ncbi:MAG: hypothetical protein AAFN10_00220 [Bacteroidota bacterium]
MRFLLLLLFLGGYSYSLNAQSLYTIEEQKEWERAIELLGMPYAEMSPADQILVSKLEEGDGPLMNMGCSWYCGGGPYKVTASSSLAGKTAEQYAPDNAHDLNRLTGWVEGAEGYGIGEYLEFHFKPNSPRINRFEIYNGYQKNAALWRKNSRVKSFKYYINGKYQYDLDLADAPWPQVFEFAPLGSTAEGEDLVLRFEIAEVYKGTHYEDVVITDVVFDGLDVHCFAPGTQIHMADHQLKPIEDIQYGDMILAYRPECQEVEATMVRATERVVHTHLVRYTFSNGDTLLTTPDHPIMLQNDSWASLEPERSADYQGFEDICNLQVGDKVRYFNDCGEWTTLSISKIDRKHQSLLTYTIVGLENEEATGFFANGVMVGVEKLRSLSWHDRAHVLYRVP